MKYNVNDLQTGNKSNYNEKNVVISVTHTKKKWWLHFHFILEPFEWMLINWNSNALLSNMLMNRYFDRFLCIHKHKKNIEIILTRPKKTQTMQGWKIIIEMAPNKNPIPWKSKRFQWKIAGHSIRFWNAIRFFALKKYFRIFCCIRFTESANKHLKCFFKQ